MLKTRLEPRTVRMNMLNHGVKRLTEGRGIINVQAENVLVLKEKINTLQLVVKEIVLKWRLKFLFA